MTESVHSGDQLPSGTAHFVKISKTAKVLLLLYASILDAIDILLKFLGLDDGL